MKRYYSLTVLVLCSTGALTGCTSVKSTYFYRNDDDTHWKKQHSKGIPITLEVPTHVRFNVIQRYFLVNGKPLRVPHPTIPGKDVVYAARDVRYDLITEKKIFTVDMKRPAAGPYQNLTTLNNQYFTQIDHRLEDKTIETVGKQVNDLVGKLLPTGSAASGKTQADDAPTNGSMVPLESVVCSQVFKLDAPDFELQVAAFLQENCGSMTGIPVDPGVQNKTIPYVDGAGGGAFTTGGKKVGTSGADGWSGSPGPAAEVPAAGSPPAVGTPGPKPAVQANSAATPTASTSSRSDGERASLATLTLPGTTKGVAITSGPTARGLSSSPHLPQ